MPVLMTTPHSFGPLSQFLNVFKDLLIFREGKGGRKVGRETSMCGCLERPQMGTWPANQACALVGNQMNR